MDWTSFFGSSDIKKNINKNLLKDSKKIPAKERKQLANYIKKNSIYSVGKASIKEIDKLNILQATLLSMKRAINNLKHKPNIIWSTELMLQKIWVIILKL